MKKIIQYPIEKKPHSLDKVHKTCEDLTQSLCVVLMSYGLSHSCTVEIAALWLEEFFGGEFEGKITKIK